MLAKWFGWLPPEGVDILLVLFLSFLIGLEREERKVGTGQYVFGGVRTFPLIGLVGYILAQISNGQFLPLTVGLLVVGGFLALSYWHKLVTGVPAGVTSEMSGLTTYLLGALVYYHHFWIATTVAVASVLLLELKAGLETMARRIAPADLLVFGQFLFLSAVVLPIVPDRDFTDFQINPFRTWLVVVAVSGISYGSYVLLRLTRSSGSVLLAAALGGAYSSTATTIAMARRSAGAERSPVYSGAILLASGVMYLRVIGLVFLFNRPLGLALAPPFLLLSLAAIAAGWGWSRRGRRNRAKKPGARTPVNPLELSAALMFAALFLAMLVATRLAVRYLGESGLYALAAVMGVADVDPFILGVTQSAGELTALHAAAGAIIVATASNHVAKGVYAYALSSGKTARDSLFLLIGLAALGLLPLAYLRLL